MTTLALDPEVVFAAMWARVDNTTGLFSQACLAASELRHDYLRATRGDHGVLVEYPTGWTLERVKASCVREAQHVAQPICKRSVTADC